jgi:predicted glycosyltransferase
MDLLKLNKKAIIIPTPGQTEQEYLATHLNQLKLFVVQSQKNISLIDAFDLSRNSSPDNNSFNFEGYKKALQELGI